MSAADDGTGTVVTQQSSQIEITGGSQSADGENLFHSFETFSVDAGDRTTFITEPTVQNVLTRVSGGSASSINGEIAVTGSQANFF
ncbi:MAG: filamentous hemagglutinin N-terminal domain-containing protein, partial [Cyanobacteria bacterium J06576_12]